MQNNTVTTTVVRTLNITIPHMSFVFVSHDLMRFRRTNTLETEKRRIPKRLFVHEVAAQPQWHADIRRTAWRNAWVVQVLFQGTLCF
jgi:hypothetical protein